MREGTIGSLVGLGDVAHVCWAHRGDDSWRQRLVEWLADGATHGQRRALVADDAHRLGLALGTSADGSGREAPAPLVVLPVEDVYGTGPVDAGAVIDRYAELTDAALRDGYRGLRVATEITPLIDTPEGLDAFARFELRLDVWMRDRPFAALCALRRDTGPAVEQLACVHPLVASESAPFLLQAVGGGLRMAGEVDLASETALAASLHRVEDLLGADAVEVDMHDLGFVDHRSLALLDRWASGRGLTLRLVGAPDSAVLVAALIDVPALRVEGRR